MTSHQNTERGHLLYINNARDILRLKRPETRNIPAVPTNSLPDIIFMLLFFFMVVTVIRDVQLQVTVEMPEATELSKLEKKSLVNHVYIGVPVRKDIYGDTPRIQLGDKFADVDDISFFLHAHREKVPESLQPAIVTSLHIDGDVRMGIVQDVKTELRKSEQLKISYAARRDGD